VLDASVRALDTSGTLPPRSRQPDWPGCSSRLLAEDLGGQERGLPDLVADPVRGHALRLATVRARRLRGALTDAAHPSTGDVLL
jgi:hypothetical protein